MATFSFTTQGIAVGYGDRGFFASGTTTEHEFDEREWVGHDLPRISGKPISWRIDASGDNKWDEYASWARPVTDRAETLKKYFSEHGPPFGLFWKIEEDTISLEYSIPSDPVLSIFILSALSARCELIFRCEGFIFVKDGVIAPVPSVLGFMERKEPLFLIFQPTILRK